MNLGNWIRELKDKVGLKMLLVGFSLVLFGCLEENQPTEYQNVKREISLNAFEEALTESGNGIRALVESGALEPSTGNKATEEHSFDQGKVQKLLGPVIEKSKTLLVSYGVSEDYLLQKFKVSDDPRLLLVALWIAQAERKGLPPRSINKAQLANLSFLLQENTLSEAKPDWMDCMLIAVGVDAIVEFAKGNVTEAIAKKAIRKIASRTLGWVGVALALYEYGRCMEWY